MKSRGQSPRAFEGGLGNAGSGAVEQNLLLVARHYFMSYANPGTLYWEVATDVCRDRFGQVAGPQIAVALLNVLRAMRGSRKTIFKFTNPFCKVCSTKTSDCERLLVCAIAHTRNGNKSAAAMDALMLCEGNDTGETMGAIEELCALIDDGQTCRSKVKAAARMYH